MSTLRNIFWNQAENRPRLAWRLIGQSILMILSLTVFQGGYLIFTTLLALASNATWDPALGWLFEILVSGLAITASVILAARILDRRRFKDLGLDLSRVWWREFGFGLGLGALLMALIFLIELGLGWIKVQSFFFSWAGYPGYLGDLALALLFFVVVGFYEELYSRGYLIKNFSEGLAGNVFQPRVAIILATLLTSAIFGLLHGANPNATPQAVVNISLAGLLLAAGYLVTGQLGLSIGLHISWNFFQGPVFGFPVSGAALFGSSLFQVLNLGPPLWTGGVFGPEGGLLGTGACLLGLGLILLWKGREGIDPDLSRYRPFIPTNDSAPALSTQNQLQIQHLIWDWNGTLLDDLDLCLEIINGMLADRDLPAITRGSYLEVFDFPVKSYYQQIGFDFSREPFESISDEFITAYEKGRPECQLIPGSQEILAHVASLGISQSILSASKGSYLTRAVAEYGIEGYFNAIQGIDNHHAAGKLELAQEFMRASSLDPSEMLLVGDTTHDGDIARSIGVNCILVPSGHHSRSRLEATQIPVINNLQDLKRILRGQGS